MTEPELGRITVRLAWSNVNITVAKAGSAASIESAKAASVHNLRTMIPSYEESRIGAVRIQHASVWLCWKNR